MALIWVLGRTEMQFWNFDRGDLSPGWRWVEIIETWRDINVSHPSRSQLISMQVSIYMRLTSIQVVLQLNPESHIFVSSQSSFWLTPMHRLTSICVPKFFKSFCNQVMLASHIHQFHVSHPSRSRELLLSSTLVLVRTPLHIQVSRCVSQPNPGPISLPIEVLQLHLNSIQITYQLCLAYKMYISPPSMCTLTAIEVHWLASHLHPGHVSLSSWSSLTLILVTIIASHLHQALIIPPSRYRGICVSLPSSSSQLHPGP